MSERSLPDDGSDRERAKGQGGLSGHELFLVIMGILLLAFSGVQVYYNYHYSGLAHTIMLAILATLFIFGVCTRSSTCMLIAMIFLILSLIVQTGGLVHFAIEHISDNKELGTPSIIFLVFAIVCYVFYTLACISTFVLRRQY